MAIKEALLPEFDQEMASTRRALERVADQTFDWRPHEKSMTMGELASHLVNVPAWTEATLKQDVFDMDSPEGESFTTPQAESNEDLLKKFDANVVSAREAIASTSDEDYQRMWTLKAGGNEMLQMPKIAVLRSFIMNHLIHHRGQLTVYLRQNDIPVPAIYGQSADEEGM